MFLLAILYHFGQLLKRCKKYEKLKFICWKVFEALAALEHGETIENAHATFCPNPCLERVFCDQITCNKNANISKNMLNLKFIVRASSSIQGAGRFT